MRITLDPSADARLGADDWAARAVKVKAEAPGWCVVMIDHDPATKGRAEHARSCLARYGLTCEAQSLRGLGRHPRPWTGWVTFARLKF